MSSFTTRRAGFALSALVVAASLAACSTPAAEPATTAETGLPAAYAGKTLVVAVSDNEAPAGYIDENGEFVGATADLLAALAEELGFEYEIETTDFAAAIPGVQSSKYDFSFRQTGITAERVDILDLVSWKYDGVTFAKPVDSDITIAEDFAGICGLTVGILQGEAASEATLTELSDACVADGETAITISAFPDRPTADLAVQSGQVDVTTNGVAAIAYAESLAPGTWASTGPVFNPVYQGLAFNEGSDLAPVFEAALNELIASGAYDEILTEWNLQDVAIDESNVDIIAE